MSEFSFAHPAVLWLLLALPFIGVLSWRPGGAPPRQFSGTDVLPAAGIPTPAPSGRWSIVWLLASLAAGILGLARPQLSNSFSQVETSGIDIMVVLDVSRSMLAEDYIAEDGRRANRIDTVKR